MDADPELDAPALRQALVGGEHTALNGGGTGNSVHHARKLDEHAVSCQLDDSAFMIGDPGLQQLAAVALQRRERAGLIRSHEAAVAHDIGCENGGETTFQQSSIFILWPSTVI